MDIEIANRCLQLQKNPIINSFRILISQINENFSFQDMNNTIQKYFIRHMNFNGILSFYDKNGFLLFKVRKNGNLCKVLFFTINSLIKPNLDFINEENVWVQSNDHSCYILKSNNLYISYSNVFEYDEKSYNNGVKIGNFIVSNNKINNSLIQCKSKYDNDLFKILYYNLICGIEDVINSQEILQNNKNNNHYTFNFDKYNENDCKEVKELINKKSHLEWEIRNLFNHHPIINNNEINNNDQYIIIHSSFDEVFLFLKQNTEIFSHFSENEYYLYGQSLSYLDESYFINENTLCSIHSDKIYSDENIIIGTPDYIMSLCAGILSTKFLNEECETNDV